jgi:hypothetical protein
MQDCLDLEAKIIQSGIDIHHLYIEPLSADWHQTSKPDHFKSGCAPVEALDKAKQLIEQGAQAVLISGEDNLKSGYSRQERQARMAVYADDYPLTQAYTDLAQQFIRHHDIDADLFKHISESLFENHKASFRHALSDDFSASMLPEEKWYRPLTELFRGVDCANPLIDFSGRVLLSTQALADSLEVAVNKRLVVAGVGLHKLDGDGPEYIDQIADYQHLKQAYHSCCSQAEVDFAEQFRQGRALLETYTCYPVVPMAFLLVSGLVDMLEKIPDFLKQHLITVTGGMNLARAPWNNPALNGMITLYQRLIEGEESLGLLHANGGLGYRQGVAMLTRNDYK